MNIIEGSYWRDKQKRWIIQVEEVLIHSLKIKDIDDQYDFPEECSTILKELFLEDYEALDRVVATPPVLGNIYIGFYGIAEVVDYKEDLKRVYYKRKKNSTPVHVFIDSFYSYYKLASEIERLLYS